MQYRDWPKQAVKLVVLIACSTAVIFQLSECIIKLIYPPVSTHTELDLNDTMAYPALTICRNPPYRQSILTKYKLGTDIRYTSEWANFPYNTTKLSDFWKEATYSSDDTIAGYGLNSNATYVNLTSAYYLIYGRCHTLRPMLTTDGAGSAVGYSVTLKHTSSTQNRLPWYVYVHQPTDNWTENTAQTTGMQELLLIRVGEEVRAKLATHQLQRVNRPKAPCRNQHGYSATRCQEQCRWNEISNKAGCSVPWMSGTGLPECDNYNSVLLIMKEYLKFAPSPGCQNKCERTCYASHFSPYIVNRGTVEDDGLPVTYSQIYVFHASKLVTSVREHWDYDLSRFVADAGGSLGFLLGVSVLSLVGLLSKAIRMLSSCCTNKVYSEGGSDVSMSDVYSVVSRDSSFNSKVTIIASSGMQKY